MTYSKEQIAIFVKEIILYLFDYVPEKNIVANANLKYGLGFDLYDIHEIILAFEHKHDVIIKNEDAFDTFMTFDEFCNALYKDLNTQEKSVALQKQKTSIFNRIKTLFNQKSK